jgi:hypothetical protein
MGPPYIAHTAQLRFVEFRQGIGEKAVTGPAKQPGFFVEYGRIIQLVELLHRAQYAEVKMSVLHLTHDLGRTHHLAIDDEVWSLLAHTPDDFVELELRSGQQVVHQPNPQSARQAASQTL